MKFFIGKIKSIFAWIKKHWKLSVFILLLVVVFFSWRFYSAQKNKPQLTWQKVEKVDLVKTLDISGKIDAKEKARLRFSAGGKVTYVGAKEGDQVKKYQTIATIDKSTLEKQLKQDLNVYMKERWDFEDYQDAYDYHVENLATRKNLDKQQWDLETEVLDVEIKDIAIRDTRLLAPFAGVLTVSPAATTGVQLLYTDYFEIVNPESLIFKAEVDEADIAKVTIGQPAEITLDAYEQENFTSQVAFVNFTSSQNSSGTIFLVEIPLTEANINKFRMGMNGDVKITLDTKNNALAVPLTATREREGKFLVDVKTEKNKYEEREIGVGLETEEYVEVISGLSEGDEVLIPE